MSTMTQNRTEPETASVDRLDPEPATDEKRIEKHLGPAFRITPIGSRRFRCNRYIRPDPLHATGWLLETFVLRVTGTGIERLSDHELRSNQTRYR